MRAVRCGADEASACAQGGGLPRSRRSPDDTEEHHISEPRINDRIRVAEVRLVGPNGEQVGIVRVEDALRLAQDVYPNQPNVRRYTVDLRAALFTDPRFSVESIGPFVLAIRKPGG